MNKKYEEIIKFNMAIVRYYADKCGTIGMFDKYDGNFKPLDLSKSDFNLWNEIAEFSGSNVFETNRIVTEQYANENFYYSANKHEKYKTPILIFKRYDNDICWGVVIQITVPALLCQYIDGVKYAYGLSATGTPFQRGVMYTRGDDFDYFKRKYTEIEKQAENNDKELERYKFLKKKYDEKIKMRRLEDDF